MDVNDIALDFCVQSNNTVLGPLGDIAGASKSSCHQLRKKRGALGRAWASRHSRSTRAHLLYILRALRTRQLTQKRRTAPSSDGERRGTEWQGNVYKSEQLEKFFFCRFFLSTVLIAFLDLRVRREVLLELITTGVLRLRATLRVLIVGLLRLRGKGHSKSKTLTLRTLAPRSAHPWLWAVQHGILLSVCVNKQHLRALPAGHRRLFVGSYYGGM